MNARKFLNVRVGLTVTALALSGAMVLAASCAGNGGSGGSSGNNGNGGSSSGNGGSSSGNGGSSGSNGGSSGGGTCSAGTDSVCFAAGQGSGVMTGFGWIALGSLDFVTSPVCAEDPKDLTKTRSITSAGTTPGPCPGTGTAVWNNPDKGLCITGSVPALPAGTPTQADYDNNWGVEVGVNAGATEGAPLDKSYSSVALTITGVPTTGLRAMLHLKGDPAATVYCWDMATSGKALTITDFNTFCWDGIKCDTTKDPTCLQLTADKASNIDKVGLQVSATKTAITVTDLCITGIAFK